MIALVVCAGRLTVVVVTSACTGLCADCRDGEDRLPAGARRQGARLR